jgi:hypothetical protein
VRGRPQQWKADAGRGDGPRTGEAGERRATGWADGPNAREGIRKRFLFLFSKFQIEHKHECTNAGWNFEILFEFSNRAHNTKYYAAA